MSDAQRRAMFWHLSKKQKAQLRQRNRRNVGIIRAAFGHPNTPTVSRMKVNNPIGPEVPANAPWIDGKVHEATGTIVWDKPEAIPSDLARFERVTINNPDLGRFYELKLGGMDGNEALHILQNSYGYAHELPDEMGHVLYFGSKQARDDARTILEHVTRSSISLDNPISEESKEQIAATVREGRLTKYGYHLDKDEAARHHDLAEAVKAHGAGDVAHSLTLLRTWNMNNHPSKARVADEDLHWVERTYEKDASRIKVNNPELQPEYFAWRPRAKEYWYDFNIFGERWSLEGIDENEARKEAVGSFEDTYGFKPSSNEVRLISGPYGEHDMNVKEGIFG